MLNERHRDHLRGNKELLDYSTIFLVLLRQRHQELKSRPLYTLRQQKLEKLLHTKTNSPLVFA